MKVKVRRWVVLDYSQSSGYAYVWLEDTGKKLRLIKVELKTGPQ